MAQVILTAVGQAVGGPIGGAIGSFIGAGIDRSVIASLAPARQLGPRLDSLHIQSTAEGSPMAAAFGRARVTGQVIWAARFKEHRIEKRSGGGKGGSQKTVQFSYSLSFAVAVCEGPIDGLGRVWADGRPMDMTGVTMRVHRGNDGQTPDPLIEAIEGSAPAYRGVAYVVFEDLALDAYGNRPPQLAFEVFRRPRLEDAAPALEDRLQGVCLIPGAGEFVYATQPVLRRASLTRTVAENVNNADGRPDLVVSLDQLQAQLPNCGSVMLVVSWFGSDLRCGECLIRPGVEEAFKPNIPITWRAGGVEREDAHLISTVDGGPAFGGTPSDQTVIQAIRDLNDRGFSVGLYPFILMDAPGFPWRGRITCEAGTDKTSGAADQVAAFFGSAAASDFSPAGDHVDYSGPDEWGLRRMILHYARLAALAGGVDTFLVGSELRGVTTIRSGAATYPAVAALKDLAQDCAAILPGAAIGYSADWSEYFGHQPTDGSGDVFFHLDPLWADSAIDFVGIDWYAPLADWRDGAAHLDAEAGYGGPHDLAYLEANIAGGEGFDWYYASDADRLAQVRTPITDGAYGEPWVYRFKDLVSWWSNAHHDRPGGVRSGSATAWTPESKPVRLIEFGCPAVDKGANSPNLFIDPKSDESALPPFSNGARDDLGQRRALEALLAHFEPGASGNPVSGVYHGPMVEGMNAWCWDARPFPDFPARGSVWADAGNWMLGHWLNGRTGLAPLNDLLEVLAARGGVEVDASQVSGVATGYVVDRPMRLRDAIAPLGDVFAFDAAERDELPAFIARDGPADIALDSDDLALPDDAEAERTGTRTLDPTPDLVRVRFIDETADYQTGSASAAREDVQGGGAADLDLPVVMAAPEADRAARRLLRLAEAGRDQGVLHVGPLAALRVEPGDRLAVEGLEGLWRVVRVDLDERPRLAVQRAEAADLTVARAIDWTASAPIQTVGPPTLLLLDLPPLNGAEEDIRPLAALAAEPWAPMDLSVGPAGDALTVRAQATQPAVVGVTLSDLPAGPLFRFDAATRLSVQVEGEALQSRSLLEVLGGRSALAVRNEAGGWEILQFLAAEAVGTDTYELSGLLRGQAGSDPEMAASTPAGAAVVLLNEDLVRADMALAERGLPLVWRAAPAGAPPGGLAMSEAAFTWSGLGLRPFAPAHLRASASGGDISITWIRRARLHGDPWDDEPPLSEERETYRVEVLDGSAVVRTATTDAPSFLYLAADQAADFPGGVPNPLEVRVAQGSAVFGWGAPARRSLGW